MSDPISIVEELRSGVEERIEWAYIQLGHKFRIEHRNHPRVRQILEESSDKDTENHIPKPLFELVNDFCLRLFENPEKLAVTQGEGTGALNVEMRRFLSEPSSNSIDERSYALKRHLFQKTAKVLRSRSDIFLKNSGDLWGLCDWKKEPSRQVGKKHQREATNEREAPWSGFEDPAFMEGLPFLMGVYKSSKEDHLPEVAKKEDLAVCLEAILQRWGRPLKKAVLADTCWKLLMPPPEKTIRVGGVGCETSIDGGILGGGQGARQFEGQRLMDKFAFEEASRKSDGQEFVGLEIITQKFIDSLPQRTKEAVYWKYRSSKEKAPLSLAQIAKILGVSRGTAENEVGEKNGNFVKELRAFFSKYRMGDEPAKSFLGLVLEKIEVEHFYTRESVK